MHESKVINTAAVSLSSESWWFCQKSHLLLQHCVVKGISFLFPSTAFFLSFPSSPFPFLPKEMRGKHKRGTAILYRLYHSTICKWFLSSDMQLYKKTWLTSAADFKAVESCVGPLYSGGADDKRLGLISVWNYLCQMANGWENISSSCRAQSSFRMKAENELAVRWG